MIPNLKSILLLAPILLCLGFSSGEPYDPVFLMNAGYGVFPSDKDALEVSEWINLTKAARPGQSGLKHNVWLGFDQGLYPFSSEKTGYLDIQVAYHNLDFLFPIGVSAGMLMNKAGRNDRKGSVWISLPFIITFTGSVGLESIDGVEPAHVNAGFSIKVPIYACCGVFGSP